MPSVLSADLEPRSCHVLGNCRTVPAQRSSSSAPITSPPSKGLCYHLRVMQAPEGDTGMKVLVQELQFGNKQPGGEEVAGSTWSGQL